ncbi:MAG: hypothetical protein AMXMBFR13_29360 [Phycisphaerae bacterium]
MLAERVSFCAAGRKWKRKKVAKCESGKGEASGRRGGTEEARGEDTPIRPIAALSLAGATAARHHLSPLRGSLRSKRHAPQGLRPGLLTGAPSGRRARRRRFVGDSKLTQKLHTRGGEVPASIRPPSVYGDDAKPP